jgi:hypothetical protein
MFDAVFEQRRVELHTIGPCHAALPASSTEWTPPAKQLGPWLRARRFADLLKVRRADILVQAQH